MAEIPKAAEGENVMTGTFVRLSEYRAFNNKRGRIGVCVHVGKKDVWFNDYGAEQDLASKYQPYQVDDRVRVSYSKRDYTDRAGAKRVARDIKSISRVASRVKEKDLEAFTPQKPKEWLDVLGQLEGMAQSLEQIARWIKNEVEGKS